MNSQKKGQGLITGLVSGIGFLVVTIIVVFLITSTLNGAGLIEQAATTDTQLAISLNDGGTTITVCDAKVDGAITGMTVINASGGEALTVTTDYTTSGCTLTGVDGDYNATTVNSSFSYSYDADAQISVDQMTSNLSTGVNNVSNKIPTVLLVAAVVLLFGAIVLLVKQSREVSGGANSGL